MARLVFFRYTPDGYVGDDANGLLVGTGWGDAFGNGFRAIVFLMDFSELKYQRSIQFIYDVEVLPEGQPKYIHSSTNTLTLSNDVLVEYDPGTAVLSRLFGRQTVAPDPNAATTIGQLDLFIGLYFKGSIAPPVTGLPPIYEWLTDLIIAAENPPAELLEETRAMVESLAAIGVILTDLQIAALDAYLRGLPQGAPSSEAAPMYAPGVPQHAVDFLRGIEVSLV